MAGTVGESPDTGERRTAPPPARRGRAALRRRARARARLETRAGEIERGLWALAQSTFTQLHGGDPQSVHDPVRLQVTLVGAGGGEWGRPAEPGADETAAAGLLAQIEQQTRDLAVIDEALVPGAVHCYRCAAAACEHAVPPRPGFVFRGYGATGVPQWDEFGKLLVGARHERADLLYGEPPQVVAHYQNGRELKQELLHAFGRASKTYDILAQVACGYFRPPPGEIDRLALTVQAVESRGRQGAFRLSLNLIGLAPPLAAAYLAENDRLCRAIERARAGLGEIERRVKGPQRLQLDALRDVPRVMRELARDLERQGRQRARRTAHAERRREEQRPVHMAIEDVRRAADDHFLFDERHRTVVVLGRRHRVHAFAAAGRHVTTMVLAPDVVDRRRSRGRWRAATEDEREGLRRLLAHG